VLAAKLAGHAGDVTRFPGRDHFAGYAGTAHRGLQRRRAPPSPEPGRQPPAQHRPAPDRGLPGPRPSPGQAYYQRKLAEAKTPEEAHRSLQRHLANVVYGHLVTDHRHRTRAC